MKVTVEIIMGRFIDTEVSEDATVKELKEKIAVEVKCPVKRLILVVGEDETRRIVMDYENEMMLRDLGVNEYPHLYLFFKNTDLVAREERFRREGDDDDDDPMEEISSEAESRRRNEEEDEELGEEEKVKISNEKEDEEMKDEKEDGDEKVEDEEEDEKLNNGDEAKDNDDIEEDEEGDNKEENLSRVS